MSRQNAGDEIETLAHLRRRLEAESSDGRKLLKSLKHNPICSVGLDESVPCLTIVWKRYATSTQLRFIHESMLQMLSQHRISKILGDDTTLPTIHAEDQQWIVENWMPRARAAGLKVAASKSPIAYFGKLAVERVQAMAPPEVIMRPFTELEAARQWLRSMSSPSNGSEH